MPVLEGDGQPVPAHPDPTPTLQPDPLPVVDTLPPSGGGVPVVGGQRPLDPTRHRVGWTDDDEADVYAAFMFHLGGAGFGLDIEQEHLKPMVDRFMPVVAENPELLDRLRDDVSTYFTLEDPSLVANPLTDDVSQVLDAYLDVFLEVGANSLWSAGQEAWKMRAREEYRRLTNPEVTALRERVNQAIDQDQVSFPDPEFDTEFIPRVAEAGTFVDSISNLPVSWLWDGDRNLIVQAIADPEWPGPIPDDDVDYGWDDKTWQLRLDPGTEIRTHLDAVTALVDAMTQEDHEFIWKEELVGNQTAMGRALQSIGDLGRQVGSTAEGRRKLDSLWQGLRLMMAPGIGLILSEADPNPVTRRFEEEQAAIPERATSIVEELGLPDSMIVAEAATRIMEEGRRQGIQLAGSEALLAAGEFLDENREDFERSWRGLSSEQLIERMETSLEETGALSLKIGETFENVAEVAAWSESFIQAIGVNIMEFLGEAGQQFAELSGALPNQQEVQELTASFQKAYTAAFNDIPEDPNTVGEFFGLEGDALAFANLVSSFVFDPTTWLLGGGAFASRQWIKMVSNPKYAPLLLKTKAWRSWSKTVAKGGPTGFRAVVAAADDLSDDAIVRLIGVAANPNAKADDAAKVLLSELPGTNGTTYALLNGPGTVMRRNNGLMLSRVLEALPDASDDMWERVSQLLAVADKGRSFDATPGNSISNFMRMIVEYSPDDADDTMRWMLRATDAHSATRGVDSLQDGVLMMRKQEIINDFDRALATIPDYEGKMVPRIPVYRQTIAAIDDELRTVKEVLRSAPDDPDLLAKVERLTTKRAPIAAQLEKAEGHQQTMIAARREYNRRLTEMGRLTAQASRPESHQPMAAVMYAWFDEKLAEVGMKPIPGKKNPFTGGPVYDTTPITGAPKGTTILNDISLTQALAMGDDQLAGAAEAVGLFNAMSTYPMPVSPFQLLAYKKLRPYPEVWQRFLDNQIRDRARTANQLLKTAFSVNVLLNPITATKASLDEIFTFLSSTGDALDAGRAALSTWPFGPIAEKMGLRFGKSSWARAYNRDLGVFSPTKYRVYDFVKRPGRLSAGRARYMDDVEKFVNGHVLGDDIVQKYAAARQGGAATFVDGANTWSGQTAIPDQEWVSWWDDGGFTQRRATTFAIDDRPFMVDANSSFQVVHDSFETWLTRSIDPEHVDKVRDIILTAAASGRRLDRYKDAATLARFNTIVAPTRGLMGGNPIRAGFGALFGAPSARRGAVFFDHYYDEAMNAYTLAYGPKGKDSILTIERLRKLGGSDPHVGAMIAGMSDENLGWLINQGQRNPVAAHILNRTGMVTPGRLEYEAARYAERMADANMYLLSATSIAGSRAEAGLLFPYARASWDFLNRWGRILTKPAQVRLPVEARRALNQLPYTRPLVAGVEAVEKLPLNVRTLQRFNHMIAAFNDEDDTAYEQMFEDLTFFPLKFGNETLADVLPTPGPLPSWLIDFMFEEGSTAREFTDAIWYTLGYTEGNAGYGDVWDYVFTTRGKSVLGNLGRAVQLIGAKRGADLSDPTQNTYWTNTIVNALGVEREIPGVTALKASAFGDMMAERAGDLIPGEPEWEQTVIPKNQEQEVAGATREFVSGLRNLVPFMGPLPWEYAALDTYKDLIEPEAWGLLTQIGALDRTVDLKRNEDGQPVLLATMQKYLDGEATQDEMRYLADRWANIYLEGLDQPIPGTGDETTWRDWFTVKYPRLSPNIASKVRAVAGLEHLANRTGDEDLTEFVANHVNADGSLRNMTPGPRGREIRLRAYSKGWIETRPDIEWQADAHSYYYSARRRLLRGVWYDVRGKEWSREQTFRWDGEKRQDVPGMAKKWLTAEFNLSDLAPRARTFLDGIGVENVPERMTVYEFRLILQEAIDQWSFEPPYLTGPLEDSSLTANLARAVDDDRFGAGFLRQLKQVEKVGKENGWERWDEFPDDLIDDIRARAGEAINRGYITLDEYNQHWSRYMGELDWSPPTPPTNLDEVPFRMAFVPEDVTNGVLEVVDGDTLSVMLDEGERLKVRLIGINAPDVDQTGHSEATRNLRNLLLDHPDDVQLVLYEPELFGVSQVSGPEGERRVFMWLYVDGVPIKDDSVFTASNPRGAGTGGVVLDLEGILNRDQLERAS